MGDAKRKKEIFKQLEGKLKAVTIPPSFDMRTGLVDGRGDDVLKRIEFLAFLTDDILPRIPGKADGLAEIERNLEILRAFRSAPDGGRVLLQAAHHQLLAEVIRRTPWASQPGASMKAMQLYEAGFFQAILDAVDFAEEATEE